MGMIILLFYVIPYLAVSTVVMVVTIKYAKKIWIRGIVAAALFLIPTYDIIITNILGAYYCATTPKAFIKETAEYPQSIYFEDNVRPFEDANINWIRGGGCRRCPYKNFGFKFTRRKRDRFFI